MLKPDCRLYTHSSTTRTAVRWGTNRHGNTRWGQLHITIQRTKNSSSNLWAFVSFWYSNSRKENVLVTKMWWSSSKKYLNMRDNGYEKCVPILLIQKKHFQKSFRAGNININIITFYIHEGKLLSSLSVKINWEPRYSLPLRKDHYIYINTKSLTFWYNSLLAHKFTVLSPCNISLGFKTKKKTFWSQKCDSEMEWNQKTRISIYFYW